MTCTAQRYLLIEIGCLECQVPSHILGTADHIPEGYILMSYEAGETGDSGWEGESVRAAIDLEAI